MTERSRPPTDEERTAMGDPSQAPRAESARPIEIGTPTEIERSEPIRVFSMKAQAPDDPSEARRPAPQHQARLRRLSEVSPQRRSAATPPGGLGYFAPPRDPRSARTRRWREHLMWGSVAVILAGVVTLGVWLLAGGR